MIDLDDFTHLISGSEKSEDKEEKQEENLVEKVVREYNEKLLKIKREYEEKLVKEREEAFKEGFQKGYDEAERKLTEQFEQKLQKLEEEYKRRLESIVVNVDAFESRLEQYRKEFLKKMEKMFLSAITEVLEFLYVNPVNAPYVSEKIGEIIEEFSKEKLLNVEVGKGLQPFVRGENVVVNEELGEGDFRINFEAFSIESSIKEKLELLREEFEREIKKSS